MLLFLNFNHFHLGPVELHEAFVYSYLKFEKFLTIIMLKIPFLSHLFCSMSNTIISYSFFNIYISALIISWRYMICLGHSYHPLSSLTPSLPFYFSLTFSQLVPFLLSFIFMTHCFHLGLPA